MPGQDLKKNRMMGPKARQPGPTPSQKKQKKPTYIITLDGKEFKVVPGYGDGDISKMSKGGRAGFKSGSKGCKLAMKGKGRAYGKNS